MRVTGCLGRFKDRRIDQCGAHANHIPSAKSASFFLRSIHHSGNTQATPGKEVLPLTGLDLDHRDATYPNNPLFQ